MSVAQVQIHSSFMKGMVYFSFGSKGESSGGKRRNNDGTGKRNNEVKPIQVYFCDSKKAQSTRTHHFAEGNLSKEEMLFSGK